LSTQDKFNLTPEFTRSLFKLYPEVEEKFKQTVPSQVSASLAAGFWLSFWILAVRPLALEPDSPVDNRWTKQHFGKK